MPVPSQLENARFSLDDADVDQKLAANLDARKVRLWFSELCTHFRCTTPEDQRRLRVLLAMLVSEGWIVQPEVDLYCRPALCTGRARAKIDPATRKRQGMRNPDERDRQAAHLLAFARAQPEGCVSKQALVTEGARIGIDMNRVMYLISHLKIKTKQLRQGDRGYYHVVGETAFSATPSVE